MNKQQCTFIYPGTFDPFTLGHKDVALRAAALCDKLIVAVSEDDRRDYMLSADVRVRCAQAALSGSGIEVVSFTGLLADYAKKRGACCIIRGVRTNSDFEAESLLALNYKAMAPEIENLLLLTARQYSHISGRVVRDIVRYGGKLDGYTDREVAAIIKQTLG